MNERESVIKRIAQDVVAYEIKGKEIAQAIVPEMLKQAKKRETQQKKKVETKEK